MEMMQFILCPSCYFRMSANRRMCSTCGHIRDLQPTSAQEIELHHSEDTGHGSLFTVISAANHKVHEWLDAWHHQVQPEVSIDAQADK